MKMTETTVEMLERIQKEQNEWAKKNFPNKTLIMPALGMVEETGEIAHATLKNTQGIRGMDDEKMKEAVADGIADVTIYAVDLCNQYGINFAECYANASLSNQPLMIAFDIRMPCLRLSLHVGYISNCIVQDMHGKMIFKSNIIKHLANAINELLALCCSLKLDYKALVWDTWKKVEARDWKKNPDTGTVEPDGK